MPYHTLITLICSGLLISSVFFVTLWLLGLDEDDQGLMDGLQVILGNFKSINSKNKN